MTDQCQLPYGKPIPIRIPNNEIAEHDRVVAEEEHQPYYTAVDPVVDDDLRDTKSIPAWREYVANGHDLAIWFLIDPRGGAHFVEHLGEGTGYEANGPSYRSRFENAYDAFWTAERNAELRTDRGCMGLTPFDGESE